MSVLLFVASSSHAQPVFSSVRPLDPSLGHVLEAGVDHSATLQSLVQQLEQSDVVVYLQCELPVVSSVRSVPPGRLVFLAPGVGQRYLVVRLDCRQTETRQAAMLAHELRHALEVAEAPQVVDRASFRKLYESIGFVAKDTGERMAYETAAARAAGSAVQRELDRSCHACRTLAVVTAGDK